MTTETTPPFKASNLQKAIAVIFISFIGFTFFKKSWDIFLWVSPALIIMLYGVLFNKLRPMARPIKPEYLYERQRKIFGIAGCSSLADRKRRFGF